MDAPKTSTTYVTGDAEFIKLCADLSYKVKNKIARKVLLFEAKRFLPMSQALIPVKSGALKRSMIVAVKVSTRKGWIRVSYGPKKERTVLDTKTGQTGLFRGRMSLAAAQQYKVLQDPTRYAHLVELGTRAHKVTAKGPYMLRSKATGKSYGRSAMVSAKPHPFMRPVFDSNAAGAVQNIVTNARQMIEQEVRNAATIGK